VQHEAYSDESRTTSVLFSEEGVARTRERQAGRRRTGGKTKEFKFSPVHDLHSALLFIRSQPLKDGDVIRFAVYPAAQPYLADVTVAGHESIKVAGKRWPAIKLDLKLQKIEKDLTLAPHQKFKRATGMAVGRHRSTPLEGGIRSDGWKSLDGPSAGELHGKSRP
jgi:hypothetical protein